MSRWTVDTSVAVKWLVPEIHSEAAARWLDPRCELLTPDLLYPEVGNILWKKAGRAELSAREVRAVCRGIASVPFRVWPSKELLGSALDAALALGRSVYSKVEFGGSSSSRSSFTTLRSPYQRLACIARRM